MKKKYIKCVKSYNKQTTGTKERKDFKSINCTRNICSDFFHRKKKLMIPFKSMNIYKKKFISCMDLLIIDKLQDF